MRKCEHLRGFGVSAIDKNDRSDMIYQSKAPELLRVEFPSVVVSGDSGYHYQYAKPVSLLDETAKGFSPRWQFAALVDGEAKGLPDCRSCCNNVTRKASRANKLMLFFARESCEVTVPFLTLLTNVNC